MRAYAAKAALGKLDDHGKVEREMLADFRQSLRPINLRYLVLVAVIGTLVVGRVIVSAVVQFFDTLFGDVQRRANDVRTALDGLASAISSISSVSIYDLANRLISADFIGLLTLTVVLLASFYCVFRPASMAFRLKRILLT